MRILMNKSSAERFLSGEGQTDLRSLRNAPDFDAFSASSLRRSMMRCYNIVITSSDVCHMKDSLPRYTLRILQVLLDKLAYIAAYEGRTKTKEIEQLIKKRIAEFELAHGHIDIGELQEES